MFLMTKTIKRSSQAKADIKQIAHYIVREAGHQKAAEKLLQRFEDIINLLATYPQMGRQRDDLQVGLRIYPVEKYLLVYRVAEQGIEIVRILHAARDIEALFY